MAVLACAENAIGPDAVLPHAILTSHKGISVEVNNTDAEGRLVLADALSYGQKEYSPSVVIDVATLTGACVGKFIEKTSLHLMTHFIVALGEYTAGLFSNDDTLATDLQKTGTDCFERCWRLPILPEHTLELKGTFSDSRSTGKVKHASNKVLSSHKS